MKYLWGLIANARAGCGLRLAGVGRRARAHTCKPSNMNVHDCMQTVALAVPAAAAIV